MLACWHNNRGVAVQRPIRLPSERVFDAKMIDEHTGWRVIKHQCGRIDRGAALRGAKPQNAVAVPEAGVLKSRSAFNARKPVAHYEMLASNLAQPSIGYRIEVGLGDSGHALVGCHPQVSDPVVQNAVYFGNREPLDWSNSGDPPFLQSPKRNGLSSDPHGAIVLAIQGDGATQSRSL